MDRGDAAARECLRMVEGGTGENVGFDAAGASGDGVTAVLIGGCSVGVPAAATAGGAAGINAGVSAPEGLAASCSCPC